MKSLFKLCLPLLATALLASCGGGGGDGHGGFTPAASGKITLTAETQDLPLNSLGADPNPGGPFTTEVTITLRRRDGSLINDSTTVNVSIAPVVSLPSPRWMTRPPPISMKSCFAWGRGRWMWLPARPRSS